MLPGVIYFSPNLLLALQLQAVASSRALTGARASTSSSKVFSSDQALVSWISIVSVMFY